MDQMHKKTDRTLKSLERRLQTEYRQAYEETTKKLEKLTKNFQKKDAEKRVLLSNGFITQEQYIAWRRDWLIKGGRLQAIQKSLANEMVKANVASMEIINATTNGVFADNANYAAFELEKGFGLSTAFNLYDQNTARILADDEGLHKKINIRKDTTWNTKKVSSAMLQSVLQGETIPQMAKRLRSVTDMNYHSSVRNARTMITGAENAGRLQGYRDMAEYGLHAKKVWEATLSGKTRESHRLVDREEVDIEESFSNGLMYPGDPNGEPGEVYNCRCTMIAKTDHLDMSIAHRWSDLPEGLSYDDWKRGKR